MGENVPEQVQETKTGVGQGLQGTERRPRRLEPAGERHEIWRRRQELDGPRGRTRFQ